MNEKKNPNPELNDEKLDEVAGGGDGGRASYWANGNMRSQETCWQCGRDFSYAPGVNMGNADDPWKHFCSPECKQKYDSRYGTPGQDPRP